MREKGTWKRERQREHREVEIHIEKEGVCKREMGDGGRVKGREERERWKKKSRREREK